MKKTRKQFIESIDLSKLDSSLAELITQTINSPEFEFIDDIESIDEYERVKEALEEYFPEAVGLKIVDKKESKRPKIAVKVDELEGGSSDSLKEDISKKIESLRTRSELVKEMISDEKDKAKKKILKDRLELILEMISDQESQKKNSGVKKSLGGFLFGTALGFIGGQSIELMMPKRRKITYGRVKKAQGGYLDSNSNYIEILIQEIWNILGDTAYQVSYVGDDKFKVIIQHDAKLDEVDDKLKTFNQEYATPINHGDMGIGEFLTMTEGFGADITDKDKDGRFIVVLKFNHGYKKGGKIVSLESILNKNNDQELNSTYNELMKKVNSMSAKEIADTWNNEQISLDYDEELENGGDVELTEEIVSNDIEHFRKNLFDYLLDKEHKTEEEIYFEDGGEIHHINPSWSNMLGFLAEGFKNDIPEAIEEFEHMAKAADAYNELLLQSTNIENPVEENSPSWYSSYLDILEGVKRNSVSSFNQLQKMAGTADKYNELVDKIFKSEEIKQHSLGGFIIGAGLGVVLSQMYQLQFPAVRKKVAVKEHGGVLELESADLRIKEIAEDISNYIIKNSDLKIKIIDSFDGVEKDKPTYNVLLICETPMNNKIVYIVITSYGGEDVGYKLYSNRSISDSDKFKGFEKTPYFYSGMKYWDDMLVSIEEDISDIDQEASFKDGGNIKSKENFEKYLNKYYAETISDYSQAKERFMYLTNPDRDLRTTEQNIIDKFNDLKLGTLLRKYDPVSFNLSFYTWDGSEYLEKNPDTRMDFSYDDYETLFNIETNYSIEFFNEGVFKIFENGKKSDNSDKKLVGYGYPNAGKIEFVDENSDFANYIKSLKHG